MTGHVYVSDSDREFRAVYGVTPGEVDEAIEENRSRIIRKLNEWGQVWAVDEIVMNIWQELIEGGLKRWAAYADRRPLGAFVNSLVDQKIGEHRPAQIPVGHDLRAPEPPPQEQHP